MKELNVGMIGFYVDDKNGGEAGFTVAQWPGFLLDGMLPSLRVNGEALTPVSCRAARQGLSAALRLEYAFPGGLGLCMHLEPWHDS
jgi:hypothetical protein